MPLHLPQLYRGESNREWSRERLPSTSRPLLFTPSPFRNSKRPPPACCTQQLALIVHSDDVVLQIPSRQTRACNVHATFRGKKTQVILCLLCLSRHSFLVRSLPKHTSTMLTWEIYNLRRIIFFLLSVRFCAKVRGESFSK